MCETRSNSPYYEEKFVNDYFENSTYHHYNIAADTFSEKKYWPLRYTDEGYLESTSKFDILSTGPKSVKFSEKLYNDAEKNNEDKLAEKVPSNFDKVSSFSKLAFQTDIVLKKRELLTDKRLVSFFKNDFQQYARIETIKSFAEINTFGITRDISFASFSLPKNQSFLSHETFREEANCSQIVTSTVIKNTERNFIYIIPRSDLVVRELLGEGAFGKVYKGLWLNSNCAIKICQPALKPLTEDRMVEEAELQMFVALTVDV